MQDRMGSVGKFHPYGEEKGPATADDREKFATYTRDAATGLDYADQRWHSAGAGRFLNADPYQASSGTEDPGSWNRVGYVEGDPGNYNDRSGRNRQAPRDATTDCINRLMQGGSTWDCERSRMTPVSCGICGWNGKSPR